MVQAFCSAVGVGREKMKDTEGWGGVSGEEGRFREGGNSGTEEQAQRVGWGLRDGEGAQKSGEDPESGWGSQGWWVLLGLPHTLGTTCLPGVSPCKGEGHWTPSPFSRGKEVARTHPKAQRPAACSETYQTG